MYIVYPNYECTLLQNIQMLMCITHILTVGVCVDQVKLAYQESEVVALLKKIPLGLVEMSAIRERAEQLRDGNFCDYRPVLPLMLASFIFDVLCTPGKHQLLFDRWTF